MWRERAPRPHGRINITLGQRSQPSMWRGPTQTGQSSCRERADVSLPRGAASVRGKPLLARFRALPCRGTSSHLSPGRQACPFRFSSGLVGFVRCWFRVHAGAVTRLHLDGFHVAVGGKFGESISNNYSNILGAMYVAILLVVVFIYVYHHVCKNTEVIWSHLPGCSADGTC